MNDVLVTEDLTVRYGAVTALDGATFSLRTGRSLRPPALHDLPCYQVEARDGKVFVTGRKPSATPTRANAALKFWMSRCTSACQTGSKDRSTSSSASVAWYQSIRVPAAVTPKL